MRKQCKYSDSCAFNFTKDDFEYDKRELVALSHVPQSDIVHVVPYLRRLLPKLYFCVLKYRLKTRIFSLRLNSKLTGSKENNLQLQLCKRCSPEYPIFRFALFRSCQRELWSARRFRGPLGPVCIYRRVRISKDDHCQYWVVWNRSQWIYTSLAVASSEPRLFELFKVRPVM